MTEPDDDRKALPDAPTVTVRLKHEEVMAAAVASHSRGDGSWWFGITVFLLLALAIWLGHFASFWLVQQVPFAVMFAIGIYMPIAIPALFGLVAVWLALRIEQRFAGKRYLKRLDAIGSPLERDGTYEITPDALVLATERMVLAPRWHAIDTVERGNHGWVLSADQLHFLIPFAAFPDADAQRPLLAAITARMTPEARARSREAVEFAAVPAEGHVRAERFQSPWADTPSSITDEATASPTAHGWLTQEQAGWAAGVIHSHVAAPGFHQWAYPLTGGVVGLLLGIIVLGTVVASVPFEFVMNNPMIIIGIGLIIPLLFGASGLAFAYRRLTTVIHRSWRDGLAARGVPDQVEATWRLTETGVRYETARFAGEATYGSIHQILSEGAYLIIAADALTLCIPEPAFQSSEDAGAFKAVLLDRISDAARARSATDTGSGVFA
jgi:hypothetical protein